MSSKLPSFFVASGLPSGGQSSNLLPSDQLGNRRESRSDEYVLVRADSLKDAKSGSVGGNQSVSEASSHRSCDLDVAALTGRPVASAVVDGKQTEVASDIKSQTSRLGEYTEGVRQAMQHVKVSRGVGKGGGRRLFAATLAIRATSTGSANTAYAPVIHLVPNSTSVTEASQFAALFDEQRTVGVTVLARAINASYSGTVPATPATAWGMVYDPANSGAYASLVGMCVASHHRAPIAFNRGADGPPVVHNGTGYVKMQVKVPGGVRAPTTASPPDVGTDWIPTTDTTSGVGYLKFYADALGSGSMCEFDYFILYHNEYRSRT